MRTKYVYPAVFTPEEDGKYSVDFPDIDGCYTCGDNLSDAIFMAEDALALMLYQYESEKKAIPEPSALKDVHVAENEFVSYIAADTLKYRKRFNKKAVKKTLTIPEWMNEAAEAEGINFSQTLQEALESKIQTA